MSACLAGSFVATQVGLYRRRKPLLGRERVVRRLRL